MVKSVGAKVVEKVENSQTACYAKRYDLLPNGVRK